MIGRPLEGIRVVDWTVMHLGPSGAMFLADLGADVIHVEQRGTGDLMRGFTSAYGTNLIIKGGRQALVEDLNRNKRSLSLDLTKPRAREIMYKLVEKTDLFVTNLRPKAVRKLQMDYETLLKYNPKIIYGQATSFGERGPEQDSAGVDYMAYARSGAMLGCGEVGMPPVPLGGGIGDRAGGIFLAFGAMTALLVRERTGEGQYFATSQLGAMVNLQAASIISQLLAGNELKATRRSEANNPLYNYYRCGDDLWVCLAMAIDSQRYWGRFCKAIGRPELFDDPRFLDHEHRNDNRVELIAILDEVFASQPYGEWDRRFREVGELVFSKINAIADLEDDPQVLENEYIVPFDHPVLGPMKQVAIPIRFSKTPWRIESPAPECGQHNEEILLNDLGMSWEEVEELQSQEVI